MKKSKKIKEAKDQTAFLPSKDPFADAEKLLKLHARALEIPSGATEDFIKRSISAAKKALKGKSIITDADLIRVISKELNKYNRDLAYVYKNCDIII